jgi:hypothetical protein
LDSCCHQTLTIAFPLDKLPNPIFFSLNLQPKQGKAKAYPVKQIRSVILKYQLGEEPDAD